MSNTTKLPPYSRREPLAVQIQRQEAKLAVMEEKLGRMMSERVKEEERLSDLYKLRARLEAP